MTLKNHMDLKTYSDAFWGPEFRSVAGAEALTKRNTEGRRLCSDFEDYLKKRAKIETDYAKSLSNLTKCFREREIVGTLEASFSTLKEELEQMSRAHLRASDSFHKQADALKKFKDGQTVSKKAMESTLSKTQESKLSQHTKTLNLQKMYVKKSVERDAAEVSCKELSVSPQAAPKDVDKARNKAIRTDEDANKADVAYKGAVMLLDDLRLQWEHEMLHACQTVQEMDEERIRNLRQELWYSMNVDSKMALDVDNSCEKVRDVLEKCDVITDLQAFIGGTATGKEHPEPFRYQTYTNLITLSPTDIGNDHPYATIGDMNTGSDGGTIKPKKGNLLSFGKLMKKTSTSDAPG